MILQLLLSSGLFVIVIYAFTQKSKSMLIGGVTMFSALSGIYFVWMPDHANALAHLLGIGRGADLIFYFCGVIGFSLLLSLHFKVRSNLELITALARHIAITEAERNFPDQEGRLPPPVVGSSTWPLGSNLTHRNQEPCV